MLTLARISLCLLAGVLLHSAAAQEPAAMLESFDQQISALSRQAQGPASARYFADARAVMNKLNQAALAPADRYERLLAVAAPALAASPPAGARRDLQNREKRNIAMFLAGAELTDVADPVRYASLRERYAATLVDFVRALRQDTIADYRPKAVSLNMPVDGADNEATRAEKERRFQAENNANNDSNRYQESLRAELQFLEPKVSDFLRRQFQAAPANPEELSRLLGAVAGESRP